MERATLARSMRNAIGRSELDLRGLVVLTEAASGAYIVTPLLAALAGAERVFAVTRSTRYGSAEEVRQSTLDFAGFLGVAGRIEILLSRDRETVVAADILTNSGHMRPVDAETIGWMKPSAVIPLMYEGWEFRPEDVDLEACRRRGIAVGGTTETHAAIDVFSFLGPLAGKLLMDAGFAVYGNRILLLCDNRFAPFLQNSLRALGAHVDTRARLEESDPAGAYDVILVSLTPGRQLRLTSTEAAAIARLWPGAAVAQFFGDIDRDALRENGVRMWPETAPPHGHMAILPTAIGPEPTVRLQTGGLKVGELLARARRSGASPEAAVARLVASGYGHGMDIGDEDRGQPGAGSAGSS